MVTTPADRRLREVVASALDTINAENGGRYLIHIAEAIHVDRATVGRWRSQTRTPSIEQCERLALTYPEHFDRDTLLTLHAQAAVDPAKKPPRVGLVASDTVGSTYDLVVQALRQPPPDPEDREVLHVMMHVDAPGGLGPDEQDDRASVEEFRTLYTQRAEEGWRVRTVLACGSPEQFERQRGLIETLSGPDVEVWGHVARVPLVICPMIIARRDVVFAYDRLDIGRPVAALSMQSPQVVGWAVSYFGDLLRSADFRLRLNRRVDRKTVAAFEAALVTRTR